MNDYKDLIDKLRFYADTADDPIYGICINSPKVMFQAADAIEQLAKERNAAVTDFKQFAIYAASKAPFACKWCKSQRSDGRCQWFIDHEDDKTCCGVHFEWQCVL